MAIMPRMPREKWRRALRFLRGDLRPMSSKPSSLARLPTEIWWMIMEYLLSSNIKDLSLVSRMFRSLTLPSLFSDLVITHRVTGYLNRAEDLQKLEARLKFYTSSAIAPYVRKCKLRSFSEGALGSMTIKMDSRSRDALFFSYLPRLFKLKNFVCEYTELDEERVGMLGQLRELKSFTLDRCGLNVNLNDTTLNVDCLETLTIHLYAPCPSFLTNTPNPAAHLRELRLTVSRTSLETYIPLLHHCTRLETLIMKASSIEPQPPPSNVSSVPSLPMLKTFYGPASYMHFINGFGCALRDVSLYHLENRVILHELASAHARHLRSLHIMVNFLTADLLEPICELAALETLDVEIGSHNHNPDAIVTRTGLIDTLTNLILPPTLQSLRVDSDMLGDATLTEHVTRLERVKDQNKGLTYLAVYCDGFCFVYR